MKSTYKNLSSTERYQIFSLLKSRNKTKISIRDIAAILNVSHSTIYREIRRNSVQKGDSFEYAPEQAQAFAENRTRRANRTNVRTIPKALKELCLLFIKKSDWSPEQVTGRFKKEIKERPEFKKFTVSHESIYQWVIEDKRNGGTIYTHLRRKGKKYNKRLGETRSRGRIPNQRSIEERPEHIDERNEFGHWEGDTVIGTQTKNKVLVTLVERKHRFTLVGIAQSKSAKDVTACILRMSKKYKSAFKTITFDNGKEFAYHEIIDRKLKSTSYFARPYHSWERGTNENTNGLLRQYFPKGESMAHINNSLVIAAQEKLNNRPRAILDFMTPKESFEEEYCSEIQKFRYNLKTVALRT